MIVKENIDFKRGKSSKQALGIGSKFQIEKWLGMLHKEGDIGIYTINDDESITVEGRVDLRGNWEGNLPGYINFKEILRSPKDPKTDIPYSAYHYFSAVAIGLTSLRGMPEETIGDFAISGNDLGDLEGCPRIINGNFHVENAELYSLEGAPDYVGGSVYVGDNPGNFMDIDVRRAIQTIRGGIHLVKKR